MACIKVEGSLIFPTYTVYLAEITVYQSSLLFTNLVTCTYVRVYVYIFISKCTVFIHMYLYSRCSRFQTYLLLVQGTSSCGTSTLATFWHVLLTWVLVSGLGSTWSCPTCPKMRGSQTSSRPFAFRSEALVRTSMTTSVWAGYMCVILHVCVL